MKKPNRLINEKSPYLLQHAYNPVDWYPWSEEAFRKAKEEDKIIFLSIGYSSCHWCHVMERESFEDEEVADILNRYFVPIKVDREERPDVDSLYMDVCMMINGSGGWPLNVFLTPDRKPFFALTYIPRYQRYGMMGIIELLQTIQNVWTTRREEVIRSSNEITYSIERYFNLKPSEGSSKNIPSQSEIVGELVNYYTNTSSTKNKFPTFHNFFYLYDYIKKTNDIKTINIIHKILKEIRLSGTYDQVGGGFHRYSTDPYWILPHFEKMLYDQAFAMSAYSLFYNITKDELFKETVLEIYEYLERELLSPEGAFFCSEDAESGGCEGEFYIWTTKELSSILGDEYQMFEKFFELSDDGNYEEETTHRKNGKNVLFFKKELIDGLAYEEYLDIKKLLLKLREERSKREKPSKDTKILTDWNGMVAYALSLSGVLVDDDRMLKASRRCVDFLITNLYKDGKLYHRYADGEVAIDGILDDYSYLILSLLQTYQLMLEDKYLEYAYELTKKCIECFYDPLRGGFYLSEGRDTPVRKKEFIDTSYPSGNSVMLKNLIILYNITYDSQLEEMIEKTIQTSSLYSYHTSSVFFYHCNEVWRDGLKKIVIVGNTNEDIRPIIKLYPTHTVVVKKSNYTTRICSEMESFKEDGFYVCVGRSCLPRMSSVQEVLSQISRF